MDNGGRKRWGCRAKVGMCTSQVGGKRGAEAFACSQAVDLRAGRSPVPASPAKVGPACSTSAPGERRPRRIWATSAPGPQWRPRYYRAGFPRRRRSQQGTSASRSRAVFGFSLSLPPAIRAWHIGQGHVLSPAARRPGTTQPRGHGGATVCLAARVSHSLVLMGPGVVNGMCLRTRAGP